jgi:hypothetical protein
MPEKPQQTAYEVFERAQAAPIDCRGEPIKIFGGAPAPTPQQLASSRTRIVHPTGDVNQHLFTDQVKTTLQPLEQAVLNYKVTGNDSKITSVVLELLSLPTLALGSGPAKPTPPSPRPPRRNRDVVEEVETLDRRYRRQPLPPYPRHETTCSRPGRATKTPSQPLQQLSKPSSCRSQPPHKLLRGKLHPI